MQICGETAEELSTVPSHYGACQAAVSSRERQNGIGVSPAARHCCACRAVSLSIIHLKRR